MTELRMDAPNEKQRRFLLEALGLRRLAAQAGYRYERGEDTDA